MAKARPKTGEARDTHQPLKIDRLPEEVHEAIRELRHGREGLTWDQLEVRSAKPYSKSWKKDKGGFVDWDALPLDVLELFPACRLPSTTLHRWYDLRVAQARQDVIEDGNAAQSFVEKLGELQIDGMNDAVQNAMVREVFGMIRTAGDTDRRGMAEALNNVSLVLTRLQRVQLQKGKLDTEQRKLKLLEEREKLTIQKLEAETDRLAKKARRGQPITEDELRSVRMKAFGF